MKRCKLCGEDFYGKDLVTKHFADVHNDSVPDYYPTFDWLCVLPGVDHLRMNAAKSIVNTYWTAYFKAIFIELGYESPSALIVAQSCSDLHKTDQAVGKHQRNFGLREGDGRTKFIPFQP